MSKDFDQKVYWKLKVGFNLSLICIKDFLDHDRLDSVQIPNKISNSFKMMLKLLVLPSLNNILPANLWKLSRLKLPTQKHNNVIFITIDIATKKKDIIMGIIMAIMVVSTSMIDTGIKETEIIGIIGVVMN